MGSHMVLDELDMIRAQNFGDPEYWPYYWPYFAPKELLQVARWRTHLHRRFPCAKYQRVNFVSRFFALQPFK